MPTAAVTGANSGIRNALARVLVKEGYDIIAADTEVGSPITELSCETSELDVSSQNDIEAFKTKIGDQPIDLLLNVTGVMYPYESDALNKVTLINFQRTFAINTFGPFLLTQALMPNIERAQHPRIAVISSRVGSIADNSTGGMYSYRSSKTAVNMLFKNLAVDLKDRNISVILLHPGIVKTNLDQKWKDGGKRGYQSAVAPGIAASDLWGVSDEQGIGE